MLLLKEIYKAVEKVLHSTEPYETPIKPSIIYYYKIFGSDEHLRELDGCQYRYSINGKEFLIIRNKYKDQEHNKMVYYDDIILENMKYSVIILPYDLIYNDFEQEILYKLVSHTVKKMVDVVFDMSNNASSVSYKIYLNLFTTIISVKVLLFDLESIKFLENKFSKEFVNIINQSDLEQLATFFWYDKYTDIMKDLKEIWEKILNEPDEI